MIGIVFWLSLIMIFYTYIGYPVLIFLLARLKKPDLYPSDFSPDVCLLIVAYNEESCIAEKLDNTLELEYPAGHIKLMVAAHGSDDRTVEIVESYADRGVKLSYRPEREGKLAAISHAMKGISADIVVFSDANNFYDSETLRQLLLPFSDVHVGAATGAKVILAEDESSLGSSEGLYWKYESFIKKQETRFSSCVGSSGEIFAIRRELFEPPQKNMVNDDFYMLMQTLRKGYRVVYVPAARSYERISSSQQDEIIRRKRISAGRYQSLWFARKNLPINKPVILWQVFSHKILRLALPFVLLTAFAVNFLALLPGFSRFQPELVYLGAPYNWLFFLLQLIFYLSAFIGFFLPGKSKAAKLFYLPTFLVSSNYAVLLGLFHFLGHKDPAVWEKVNRHQETGGENE
ncbi:MAG: glycosyltransferase family 2 protein [Anaerolineales bacterium]|nr:glycosyltransferase family 2 protein [Anaerolineales bacterium]